jgi:hypothetical protein
LEGAEADWFRNLGESNPTHSDMGALILAGKVMQFVEQAVAKISSPTGAVDPSLIRQAVIEALQADNTDLVQDVLNGLAQRLNG